MRSVCDTFVRKYTHARIGGYIRAKSERERENRKEIDQKEVAV